MKSNEFNVDEGFKDIAKGALQGLGRAGQAAKAANPLRGALSPLIDPFRNTKKINNEKHKSLFVNSFAQQFTRDHQRYPQLTLPDFMEMYWTKNNWDISQLPPSYKTSLDSAMANTEAANFSITSLHELGDMVYDIVQRVPGANRQPDVVQPQQQPQQQTTQPASSPVTGQIDGDTSQIISKIRSMKNTPEEIDDLIDIASMTLIKLYKISPKNYKRIIVSLFNNGGRPSASAAIDTAQQPVKDTTPPNYSGGHTQAPAPSSINYNNIPPKV